MTLDGGLNEREMQSISVACANRNALSTAWEAITRRWIGRGVDVCH